MVAFIEVDMNNLHIGKLVLMASIPNLDDSVVIPNFFCKFKKTLPTHCWFAMCTLRNTVSDLFMCVSTTLHPFPDTS